MQPAQPGQRVKISPKADCRIHLRGSEAARIAVAAMGSGGRVLAFDRIDQAQWFMQGMAELEGDFEIVAYVMDDRHGGFTNHAFPIEFEVDGTVWQMPQPTEQLAAVILAEVYTKNGERADETYFRRARLEISGVAFTDWEARDPVPVGHMVIDIFANGVCNSWIGEQPMRSYRLKPTNKITLFR